MEVDGTVPVPVALLCGAAGRAARVLPTGEDDHVRDVGGAPSQRVTGSSGVRLILVQAPDYQLWWNGASFMSEPRTTKCFGWSLDANQPTDLRRSTPAVSNRFCFVLTIRHVLTDSQDSL
jgi:hypothetical protein